MIRKIEIKKRASYDESGVTIDNLKQINFIYGTNGSGKTTISDFIKNIENYPQCNVLWVNNSALRRIVYNKEFIEENFHQNSRIKGIFTLGKESHDIQQSIENNRVNVLKIDNELAGLENTLNNKNDELIQNENVFEEQCWALKQKYDASLQEAFSGVRGSKRSFKEKCKTESNNPSGLEPFEEIKQKYDNIFSGSKEKIQLIPKIAYEKYSATKSDTIFNTKIIGREDLDISNLITKLNISDWVRQGHHHMQSTEGVCPFCQREVDVEFIIKLDDFFNEDFNKKVSHLELMIFQYSQSVEEIIFQIDEVLKIENRFFDKQELVKKRSSIEAKNQTNILLLSQKRSEPSRIIELESFSGELSSINELFESVNVRTRKHNELIDNYNKERSALISSIWRFIVSENATAHKTYVEKEFNISKAIMGIKGNTRAKKELKYKLIKEIEDLENQITSVIPSINEMNNILKSFNFTNFKFAETEEKGSYCIIREDGADATDSLSEGEKTFVTFLYFIQLLNGSNDKNRITDNKIVVIDDPISSLDSNVLFIVSNLIKGIIDEMRTNKRGTIHQLFVLTHNIYFHKEVTFNKGKGTNRLADETFWILRKNQNISSITSYDTNPIKSSYELMWQEIKHTGVRSSSTVQNLIRRIIENYFKIFGNYDEDDIINKFENEEKVICRSLISWANDGSHYIMDDLYAEATTETIEKYLKVFARIFEVTGHSAHYRMMMGIAEDSLVSSI